MPEGCWVDVFDGSSGSGQRRRLYGPGAIDRVIWLTYRSGDRISIRLGPAARALVTLANGDQFLVNPGGEATAIDPSAIADLRIEEAGVAPLRRPGKPVAASAVRASPRPSPRSRHAGPDTA